MLLIAGAQQVLAIEPSQAADVLAGNLGDVADKVRILKVRGEDIPPDSELDFVVSIGVIHHIPDPQPVIKAVLRAMSNMRTIRPVPLPISATRLPANSSTGMRGPRVSTSISTDP